MNNILFKRIPDEERSARKILSAGEHMVFKRIIIDINSFKEKTHSFSLGGEVNLPEGYQIVSFHTSTLSTVERINNSYDNIALDVWFINTEVVEVIPTFNEVTCRYEYCDPGRVLQKNEDLGTGFKLTP